MNVSFLKIRSSRIIIWFFIWVVAILCIGEFALSQGYPWRFSRLEPYFLRTKNDDYVHNAFVIERIREADHPLLPLYIFIGSSAAREAIREDAYLEDAYEEKTGKRIEFISVCTSATSLSDDAKATEAIGPVDAVFLVAIDPLRFSQNAKFQLERPMKKGHINTKYFFLTPPRVTVQTLSDYGFPPDLKQRLRLIRTASTLGEILKKQLIYFFKTKGKLKSLTYERHLYKKPSPGGARGPGDLF